jgi:hypothetical protein
MAPTGRRKSTKFSPDVMERAVRMIEESAGQYYPSMNDHMLLNHILASVD